MRVKTRDMQQNPKKQHHHEQSRYPVPHPINDPTRPVLMKAHLQTSSVDTDVSLTFEDNRRASLVFGLYDENLVHIERRLSLQITANGNHVVIKGPQAAAEQARYVLEALYEQVRKGITITTGEVDGAIEESVLQGSLFPYTTKKANVEAAHKNESMKAEPMKADSIKAEPLKADKADLAPSGRVNFQQISTRKRGSVKARNAAQDAYLRELYQHELVFAEGPAGTGKTWLAVGYAVQLMEQGIVERLILSRPAVEAGERLGFLPGDMREKVDPYLRPVYDALYDFMEARDVERALATGIIEIAPLAFMRGRTLTKAAVLLDEAQNTTSMQMKMFLTRLGEGSRMIVTGDPSQVDLPAGQKSGLVEATRVLSGVEGVGHVRFRDVDVVRHPLVRRIVHAYDAESGRLEEQSASMREEPKAW